MLQSKRRRAPRAQTCKTGRIAASGKPAVHFCVILNLSETGACLRPADPAAVPEYFDLLVDGAAEPSRRCRVIWRKETRLGVEFQSVQEPLHYSAAQGGPWNPL